VYLDASHIFPYIGESTDPASIANFWSSSGPFFWIFIVMIITSFSVFTLYSKIKTAITRLKRNEKIILFSIVFVSLAGGAIYAYETVYEYQVEQQIIQLYHEILARSPDPDGLSYWKNAVLKEGRSLDWVEETIKNSTEAQSFQK
jgi:hypothetical protein